MKLIDLLVKELPHRGGWPEFASICWCDPDGEIRFDNDDARDFYPSTDFVDGDDLACSIGNASNGITEAQYDSALAASKAVVGHDGWIQWAGGKCPVDSDAIVEVKFRNPSRNKFNNDRAGDFTWSHDGFGGDIIAYRLQQPDIDSRASDEQLEQDLNECIGQDVDAPEWNGEGLPPDGVECEVRYVFAASNWMPFRCVKSDAGVAFGWSGGDPVTAPIGKYEFRPLPGHREATRDAACDKICDAIRDAKRKTNIILTAESIYDAIAAGKIPGVKLEENNGF